jgi:hypothetical protein
MRLAAGIAVLAIALPAALWIHQRRVSLPPIRVPAQAQQTSPTITCPGRLPTLRCVLRSHTPPPETTTLVPGGAEHPSWEDPAALLLALGGLAAAVGVASRGRYYGRTKAALTEG